MADERSLLRAAAVQRDARAGAIHNRWASYHPKTGVLRCVACDYTPLKHERLWAAHEASAFHRDRVALLLAQEKKKVASDPPLDISADAPSTEHDDAPSSTALLLGGTDSQKKRKETEAGVDTTSATSETDTKRARRTTSLDDEWALFQRTVVQAGDTGSAAQESGVISAEPQLVSHESQPEAEVDSEAAERARLDRATREDFLARLDAEQDAQQEGAERCVSMRLNNLV